MIHTAALETTSLLTAAAAVSAVAAILAVLRDAYRRREAADAFKAELDRAVDASERLLRAVLSARDLPRADLSGIDLHEADLREKNLREANLSRAFLSAADLSGADCSRARLRGADLTGANCRAATFAEADLLGARLSGATLTGAVLARANLRDADLTRAHLVNADLTDALLAGADLRGARLHGAKLAGADISSARMPAAWEATARPAEHRALANDALIVPLYFAVDVSYSMSGAPVEALRAQLQETVLALQEDPLLVDLTWMSLITFSDTPEVVTPLSPVERAAIPPLHVGGATAYGPVLDLLHERIEDDLHVLKQQGARVYRPLVFFITDGAPTDVDWQGPLKRLTSEANPLRPHIVALGFGAADPDVLREVGSMAALSATEEASVVEAIRELAGSFTASVHSAQQGKARFPTPSGFVPL